MICCCADGYLLTNDNPNLSAHISCLTCSIEIKYTRSLVKRLDYVCRRMILNDYEEYYNAK